MFVKNCFAFSRCRASLALLGVAALIVGGCSDSDDPTDPGNGAAEPAHVDAFSAPEAVTAGEDVDLAVVVTDEDGGPVQGVSTEWTIVSGGGRLSDDQVATDGSGVAEIIWTVGDAAGDGEVSVEVPDVGGMDFALTIEPMGFRQVAAGFSHTCALRLDGSAFCWGRNTHSKIGDGTDEELRLSPAPVVGGFEFEQLASGGRHTCAVTNDGEAYCWGSGAQGQLGNRSDEDFNEPVSAQGDLTFRSVSAGNFHSCGVTPDDEAYCWGHNSSGQLGVGDTSGRDEPTPVEGGLAFTTVEAGGNHSCGITTDGETYCWGNGGSGQLGDGEAEGTDEPVQVAGGHEFVEVDTNQHFSCGLTADNEAYCWGAGGSGELGTGSASDEHEPAPVTGDLEFQAIDLGPDRTCGLTTDGDAYCWGASFLGDGTDDVSAEPVAVAGGLTFRQVSRGTHACGITEDDQVYCWGRGTRGRLGTGATDDHLEPVPIADPES